MAQRSFGAIFCTCTQIHIYTHTRTHTHVHTHTHTHTHTYTHTHPFPPCSYPPLPQFPTPHTHGVLVQGATQFWRDFVYYSEFVCVFVFLLELILNFLAGREILKSLLCSSVHEMTIRLTVGTISIAIVSMTFEKMYWLYKIIIHMPYQKISIASVYKTVTKWIDCIPWRSSWLFSKVCFCSNGPSATSVSYISQKCARCSVCYTRNHYLAQFWGISYRRRSLNNVKSLFLILQQSAL